MSYLIKEDLPDVCSECPCMRHDCILAAAQSIHAYQCNITGTIIRDPDYALSRKEADCPLIEVATPHGPLIDENEIYDEDGYQVTLKGLERVVVIEADNGR